MRRFKLPKLSHPWAKSKAGFTLVELIVVIAIMGVLAGVGTVGYSGYVKASKKGNDKTLVGNIMRAIEVGTNSCAFVSDDSFKLGNIAYPVGFVTLSTEGVEVVQSGSTLKYDVEGDCVFGEIEVAYKKDMGKVTFTCTAGHSKKAKVFNLVKEKVRCCLTHNDLGELKEAIKTYSKEKYWCECGGSGSAKWKSSYFEVPAGTSNYVEDLEAFKTTYGQHGTSGMCSAAYASQNGSFELSTPVKVTNGAIYDALVAAFGEEQLSTMTLSYDGWTTDEGVDFATFYTSAPKLMESVEKLSNTLVSTTKLLELLGKEAPTLSSDSYTNGGDLLVGVSGIITEEYTDEESWLNAWDKAADTTWEDPSGFGLAAKGMDVYAAARMSYNNAFASYVHEMDPSIDEKYINVLRNFFKPLSDDPDLKDAVDAFADAGLGMPGLVNTDAFTSTSSPLKDKFVAAGDTYAGEKGSVFNKCQALFETYKDSNACKENGKLVYNVLDTFHDTSDVANAYVDMKDDLTYDLFDYYNNYVNEMAGLYNKAMGQDGIVIVVVMEDGKLNFQVNPTAANPRNN